eukprot:7235727-Prorocentrum_lima.AAC.1
MDFDPTPRGTSIGIAPVAVANTAQAVTLPTAPWSSSLRRKVTRRRKRKWKPSTTEVETEKSRR